jgi:SAM-dependent MidA family methyltransferase
MTRPDRARVETPLAAKLKERIRRDGTISVADFMRACLQDPEHGYYKCRAAIGADGDFITAPEISQVFGELIGLWCAVVWQRMGSPRRIDLIELGPGRGTLMRDAIRASRIVPGFHEAVAIRLVESSSVLIEAQRKALSGLSVPVSWHGEVFSDQAPVASLVIGNEYLDALPIDQATFHSGAWHVRRIGIDGDGALTFEIAGLSDTTPPEHFARDAADGDIWEHCDGFAQLSTDLQSLSQRAPLAALFVDYGHLRTSPGETLQCVHSHRPVGVFDMPGLADMTAHVDFEHLSQDARRAGLSIDGPVTQAEFLGRLGISERASRLMGANPSKAGNIEAGVARLISPSGMGGRFKAIGIRSPNVAPLPGFASANDSA